MKWFRKPAERGNAYAQYVLGWAYITGAGVPVDYIKAHVWSNLAATYYPSSFRDDAITNRAIANRDLIERQMTTEQITNAQRLTREWKPISSQQ
jgi:hypothetical protein